MNRLFIDLGGHHLVGDDLLFSQQSCEDPFPGLVETLGIPLLAISGVVLNTAGPTISWTAGWLYINGELCRVDAGAAALGTDNTWIINQTYDPLGTQVYEDLNTVNTYVLRKAIISGNAGGVNLFSNLLYLKDYFLQPLTASLGLGPMGLTWSGTGTYGARATVNQINEVVLTGPVSTTSYNATTQAIICTLINPPPRAYTFACAATIGTTDTTVSVDIDVSGNVSPRGLTAGQAVTISLDSIRYSLYR